MAIKGKLEIGIMNGVSESVRSEPLIDLSKFSSLSKLVGVQMNVVRFVNRLKSRTFNKNIEVTDSDLRLNSLKCLIKCEQQLYYSNEHEFLKNPTNAKNDIPPLSSKMNLFLDCDGLIKVKCKFGRFQGNFQYPILLPKDSTLTALIIRDQHFSLSHASFYTLLANMRKKFWIESVYSTVKKVVKNCLVCRRFNNKTVKLN